MTRSVIKTSYELAGCLGFRWLFRRAFYELIRRSGIFRITMPAMNWDRKPLASFLTDPDLADPQTYLSFRKDHSPFFFFNPETIQGRGALFKDWDAGGVSAVEEAEAIINGDFKYFGYSFHKIGFPPNWRLDPLSRAILPAKIHWSKIEDFGEADLRTVWEPNRFSWAYTLVRAYYRTGDEIWAETFWRLVEDWRLMNPPQTGPNWKCGQEISFRIMALCWGLYGFLPSPATTGERVCRLSQIIAHSATRIEANIGYALNQENNHGVSEAMGLWTVGLLFPEFGSSGEWREKGRRLLEEQARRLIYDDGGFSQGAINYHRLMMSDYLWSAQLGAINGEPLSESLIDSLDRSRNFLFHLTDPRSGGAPLFGANDGALILPLNNCEINDFRPIVQSVTYLTHKERQYGEGPWDEDLLWLFGSRALEAPVAPTQLGNWTGADSGTYLLRSDSGHIFTRAPNYRHRPHHADSLHVDIWYQGRNIGLDPGVYMYGGPNCEKYDFSSTLFHNAVSVDSLDQMERVGKFLWLPWVRTVPGSFKFAERDGLIHLECGHDGYERAGDPVRYTRGILGLGSDTWIVIDRLCGRATHDYRIHWLFSHSETLLTDNGRNLRLLYPEGDYFAAMRCIGGPLRTSLVSADPVTGRGWRSPSYGSLSPALSWAGVTNTMEAIFITALGPGPMEFRSVKDLSSSVEVEFLTGAASYKLSVNGAPDSRLVNALEIKRPGEGANRIMIQDETRGRPKSA